MTENDLPLAVAEKRKGIPIVWLLPLIALAIGGWLFYKSLIDAPVDISIRFPTGEGIELGKTEVKFKGIVVGRVSDINVNSDLQSVTVIAEIEQRAKKALVQGTEFWLVKPEVSLSGVSGLETLVSGTYITFRPGNTETAKAKRKFVALSAPPPLDYSAPGLHLTLEAEELGSIFVGAPVLFSGITIGSVQAYQLREDGRGVDIQIYVKPEYRHLVKIESRFYNSSGVSFSGDLSGFDLQMNSLASLFVGGVALFNSEEYTQAAPEPKNGDRYVLYESFSKAEAGVTIHIHFPSSQNLKEGDTEVKYKGFVVGVIKSLKLNDDMQSVTAEVLIKPSFEQYLTTGTKFWLVKPELSLSEVTGLETLVTGSYIGMKIGEGSATRVFSALSSAPPLDKSAPGLHLRLQADNLGSIGRGTEVFYRRMPVGSVQGYQLDKSGRSVFIDVFIDPEYAHLVTENSRFWNASGIDLEGGLSGIRLRTESMVALISGGISFMSPSLDKDVPRAKNGDQYRLHESFDSIRDSGLASASGEQSRPSGLDIELTAPFLGSLKRGVSVYYRDVPVGRVTGYALSENATHVRIFVNIEERYRALVRENSVFWNSSGINLSVGLFSGAELKADSLETVLAGGIAFATPDTQPLAPIAAAGAKYQLYDKMQEQWAHWKPEIPLH